MWTAIGRMWVRLGSSGCDAGSRTAFIVMRSGCCLCWLTNIRPPTNRCLFPQVQVSSVIWSSRATWLQRFSCSHWRTYSFALINSSLPVRAVTSVFFAAWIAAFSSCPLMAEASRSLSSISSPHYRLVSLTASPMSTFR